jgi:hypothetical protein
MGTYAQSNKPRRGRQYAARVWKSYENDLRQSVIAVGWPVVWVHITSGVTGLTRKRGALHRAPLQQVVPDAVGASGERC